MIYKYRLAQKLGVMSVVFLLGLSFSVVLKAADGPVQRADYDVMDLADAVEVIVAAKGEDWLLAPQQNCMEMGGEYKQYLTPLDFSQLKQVSIMSSMLSVTFDSNAKPRANGMVDSCSLMITSLGQAQLENAIAAIFTLSETSSRQLSQYLSQYYSDATKSSSIDMQMMSKNVDYDATVDLAEQYLQNLQQPYLAMAALPVIEAPQPRKGLRFSARSRMQTGDGAPIETTRDAVLKKVSKKQSVVAVKAKVNMLINGAMHKSDAKQTCFAAEPAMAVSFRARCNIADFDMTLKRSAISGDARYLPIQIGEIKRYKFIDKTTIKIKGIPPTLTTTHRFESCLAMQLTQLNTDFGARDVIKMRCVDLYQLEGTNIDQLSKSLKTLWLDRKTGVELKMESITQTQSNGMPQSKSVQDYLVHSLSGDD